jgi:RsiW-degrading membrane proteinase PrsW (M82 family)
MIRNLLYISLAPVVIIALYVYIRDKYEKEPLINLLKALLAGVLIVFPIVFIEDFARQFTDQFPGLLNPLFTAFGVASITEEGFKLLAFMLLFWSSRDFNERFDGIVYAVFVSLGFAAIENIFYVYKGGYEIGLLRALTAVPAHALFGTVMGYHLANARFYPEKRNSQLLLAFLVPFTWHGLYDFLLMGKSEILLAIFIPVFIYFWVNSFKKMNELSDTSVFRNDFPAGSNDQSEETTDYEELGTRD